MLELPAGARDDQHERDLRRLLARCRSVPLDEPADHEAAAALYRTCRRSGTTIGRLPDCLIAAVAIRNRVDLLHADSDFDAIARHSPLSVVPPAPRTS